MVQYSLLLHIEELDTQKPFADTSQRMMRIIDVYVVFTRALFRKKL